MAKLSQKPKYTLGINPMTSSGTLQVEPLKSKEPFLNKRCCNYPGS
jgi:hypothetical protein